MEDPKTGDHMLVLRDDRKWLVDLKDIMSIEPNLLKRKSLYCLSNSVLNKVLSLHERMGHPGVEAVCKAIDSGAWMNANLTSGQVRRVMKGNPCLICMLAKWNKPSIGVHEAKDNDLKVGEVISGDIVGKINPSTDIKAVEL